MQPSKLELVLDRLRESGDRSTIKMVQELIEEMVDELRVASDTTTGDDTVVNQGKRQGLNEFKNNLNLQEVR